MCILEDDKKQELPDIELDSGAFTFYNNRICVRRDFRITKANKKRLEREPYKKSDVLYLALKIFFKSKYFLTPEGVSFVAKKLDNKTAPRANLWVEYEQDVKIKKLKQRGVSRQAIMNIALDLYFKKDKKGE
jgi:hypothetical protein